MKLYRLKHLPTGLYYQPKVGGNNLSKKGKIYQTSTHGLSKAMKYNREYFWVEGRENSQVFKQTKEILNWEKSKYGWMEYYAKTKVSDWVVEEFEV